MSVHKWAYEPEKCDNKFCYGECDYCPRADDPKEVEDGDMEFVLGRAVFDELSQAVKEHLEKKEVDFAAGLIEAKIILCGMERVSYRDMADTLFGFGYDAGYEDGLQGRDKPTDVPHWVEEETDE